MNLDFSGVLAALRPSGEGFVISLTDDWAQGRSIFGGMQVAVALRAMRTLVPSMPLRALQTTFIAPVPPGETFVQARVLRAGRNVTHVEARLLHGDDVACIVVGIFGESRKSVVEVTPVRPEQDEASAFELPFVPGLSPPFTQHFDVRWLRGGIPFTRGNDRSLVVELGMRDACDFGEAHVVAFADYIPPIALSMLDTMAPGSSVTWLLELVANTLSGLPMKGFRVDAELATARDGYTSQSAILWSPRGEAIALSRQSMVVFG